jgi:hypothetical protein
MYNVDYGKQEKNVLKSICVNKIELSNTKLIYINNMIFFFTLLSFAHDVFVLTLIQINDLHFNKNNISINYINTANLKLCLY